MGAETGNSPKEQWRVFNGVRVLACLTVISFHVALIFVVAEGAWSWYDIMDRERWTHVVVGPTFMYAMNAFLIITGFLAAAGLIPQLESQPSKASQVITAYWSRRLWRILPAYYLALAINGICRSWPAQLSVHSAEADRLRIYWPMGESRAHLTQPLLISNITLDMRSALFTWNVPLQMQFYLLFPVVLCLLGPSSRHFRQRIAMACFSAIACATLYRAAMVVTFKLQAKLPVGAHSDRLSHHPVSFAAAWGFLDWLYSAFITRMTDFSLGILMYLISSSPRACAALRFRPLLCTVASAIVTAFAMLLAFGDNDIRPDPNSTSPMAARMGILVVAGGIIIPVSTAWLMLYSLVQPSKPAKWLSSFLAASQWDGWAARTFSVFLLHPFVAFWMFQAVPIRRLIGPLGSLQTFVTYFGILTAASFALAAAQDYFLDRLVSSLRARNALQQSISRSKAA